MTADPILPYFIKNIPKPRAATSVASKIGVFPCLNSDNTQSLSDCALSP